MPVAYPELIGSDVERLWKALLATYNRNKIEQLIAFKFQPPRGSQSGPIRRFDDFTDGPYEQRVLQLIQKAEEEGWTDALVREAHEYVPGSTRLSAFHDYYFSSTQRQMPGRSLERIVQQTNTYLDPAAWREHLALLERRVCRIDLTNQSGATGFLVGPGVVMTNRHVIEGVIDGKTSPAVVALVFDNKMMADHVVEPGHQFRLATDWHIDSSPWSQVDLLLDPRDAEPGLDELDYALVRLDRDPAADVLDGKPRGWIEMSADRYDFAPQTPLNILQHPNGAPLKLAIDPDAVVKENSSRTRVTYKTNTDPGSSGSPCFDKDWRLVALHHSGDPDFKRQALYNEGIPIHTIREHLRADVRRALGWS